MVRSATPNSPADIRLSVDEADPIEVVETEMALLQRALERLGRRGYIRRELDRASYLVARLLGATGPISLKDLACRLGLDATTVTRQVAAMETQGLVSRRTNPTDGRVNLIELSRKGERKMQAEQCSRRACVTDLLAEWPDRDQVELGRLLSRLNDAVRDIEPDRSG